MSTGSRTEIEPLLKELDELCTKFDDDSAKLTDDPISKGTLATGDDDLIEL